MTELVAFLRVAVVVIVRPGRDTALTISSTLLGGRRSSVFTAPGVTLGQPPRIRRALAAATGAVLVTLRARIATAER